MNPLIIGACCLFLTSKARRSKVGADANSQLSNTETAPQPQITVRLPFKAKIKEMTTANIVELATVANKIQALADTRGSGGGFKAPVNDPGLNSRFESLLDKLKRTLRQLEQSPLDDAPFWQRFSALAAIYRYYRDLQLELQI